MPTLRGKEIVYAHCAAAGVPFQNNLHRKSRAVDRVPYVNKLIPPCRQANMFMLVPIILLLSVERRLEDITARS